MAINQDTCPICTLAFKNGEALVRYVTWGEKQSLEKLGHLDCGLYLSNTEERNHPPTLEDRISKLENDRSKTVARLARRITNLGG